jgi:hypothetical protein
MPILRRPKKKRARTWTVTKTALPAFSPTFVEEPECAGHKVLRASIIAGGIPSFGHETHASRTMAGVYFSTVPKVMQAINLAYAHQQSLEGCGA